MHDRDDLDHVACVEAWLAATPAGAPAHALVDALQAALDALWSRAAITLGVVTLTAIVDRVLTNARDAFPALSPLELGATESVDCKRLRAAAGSVPVDQLRAGMRFVLVELLTVLGNLTADILTRELHAELSKVVQERGTSVNPGDASGGDQKS